MDDTIPPISAPAHLPPIRTQEDLHRRWRMFTGRLGFGGDSLWVHLLDEHGRSTPVILQIEDLDPVPDVEMPDHLERFIGHLLDDSGGSVAFLLSRPGGVGITPGERRWAQVLTEVVRRVGTTPWPVHRANDHELVVVSPDDLAAGA